MKIGILTFQFAHNYGALLQAYALKCYMDQLGHNAVVINYIPDKLRKEYSMNPFDYSRNLKVVLSLTVRNYRRRKQNRLFNQFQNDELELGQEIFTRDRLINVLNACDVVSVGSDQVWNTGITGEIKSYFLEKDVYVKKLSYAASFGTDEISEFQRNAVNESLPLYSKVSVRELQAQRILERNGIQSEFVCDPVFLLNRMDWDTFARKPESMKNDHRFILMYGLSVNSNLAKAATSYAEAEEIPMYVIHPTAQRMTNKGIHLVDVGPREFVWLIQHAEKVYSNSFHATAFSIMYGKTLVYDSVKGLGSRVESLFHSLGMGFLDGVNEYNLGIIPEKTIADYAKTGKEFLSKALIS